MCSSKKVINTPIKGRIVRLDKKARPNVYYLHKIYKWIKRMENKKYANDNHKKIEEASLMPNQSSFQSNDIDNTPLRVVY